MLEHEAEDQDEGDETANQDAYVAMKRSNALAGADASGRVMSAPARTLADLSVHLDQPLALQRALSLWRQQGVVVFPAMLAPEAVHKLACHVRAAVAPEHAVPRVANIRNPDFRTLRGLHVRERRQVHVHNFGVISPQFPLAKLLFGTPFSLLEHAMCPLRQLLENSDLSANVSRPLSERRPLLCNARGVGRLQGVWQHGLPTWRGA
jgi:hypothetical protein